MAKRKSKSKTHSPAAPTNVSANRPVRLAVVSAPRLSPQTLRELQDLRRFDPTASTRPASSVRRDQARLTQPVRRAKKPTKPAPLWSQPQFAVPKKVAICVRRQTRKEVLHAKKVAGKSGLKKPRRNMWSKIRC